MPDRYVDYRTDGGATARRP